MDLGIEGKWALVCAASMGLGKACAKALVAEGVNVVITGRREQVLEETAQELRALGRGEVRTSVGDIATPEGRAAALAACPQVDILINNAGGPPGGDFRNWSREDWIKALDANMLTPIELIKAVIDPMISRGFGRIVNITSGAVKAPIAALGMSNGARTGLTGFVAGLSREVARTGVTINNLLPGPFSTSRLINTVRAAAKPGGPSAEELLEQRRKKNPSQRFGEPDEFGAACAFLCSKQAGYIVGQNILLDGGDFPGTL